MTRKFICSHALGVLIYWMVTQKGNLWRNTESLETSNLIFWVCGLTAYHAVGSKSFRAYIQFLNKEKIIYVRSPIDSKFMSFPVVHMLSLFSL